jgi:hypothetical protein
LVWFSGYGASGLKHSNLARPLTILPPEWPGSGVVNRFASGLKLKVPHGSISRLYWHRRAGRNRRQNPTPRLGMMLANVPAVVLGDRIAERMPTQLVHRIAAAIFAVMGIATLLGAGAGLGL